MESISISKWSVGILYAFIVATVSNSFYALQEIILLEDYWIEDILQRAFTAGTLPYREALHPINLATMEEIWKAN